MKYSVFVKICACFYILFTSIITQNHLKGQFIPIDGGKLYYQTFGTGTPILIINGGPGMNSDGFVELAKKLSKNNKTIIYDQRGTGNSRLGTVSSATITMDLMADDIEKLRETLDIDRWIILGHSFGGIMANYYAAHYPEHVMGLIHSSSGGSRSYVTG